MDAAEKKRLKTEAKKARRKERQEKEFVHGSTEIADVGATAVKSRTTLPSRKRKVASIESMEMAFKDSIKEAEKLKRELYEETEKFEEAKRQVPDSVDQLPTSAVLGNKTRLPSASATEAANRALNVANCCDDLVQMHYQIAAHRSGGSDYINIPIYRKHRAIARQEAVKHFELSKQLGVVENRI